MPRKVKDPIVQIMQYFETASVDAAKTALEVVTEIVRRRATTKLLSVHNAKTPPNPLRSRAEEATANEVTPADAPKARRIKKTIYMPEGIGGGLPGLQSQVGE